MSGLEPSGFLYDSYLALRPRLLYDGPLALRRCKGFMHSFILKLFRREV
jgi:hypothetical protein